MGLEPFGQRPKSRSPRYCPSSACGYLPGRDADWAADEYIRWLPSATGGCCRFGSQSRDESSHSSCSVEARHCSELLRKPNASRPVFRVLDGLLARESPRGRLEFRTVLDGSTLIVAVHQFVPRLPWWDHRATQALGHAWVIARFRRHLRQLSTLSADESRTTLKDTTPETP